MMQAHFLVGLLTLGCCHFFAAKEAWAGHRNPWVGPPPTVGYAGNRIAIDADGNLNDPDDWAATPASLAILAAAGRQDRLVHYSYSNSLGEEANDPVFYDQMRHSIGRSIELYGLDPDIFFDAQTELEPALESLRAEIDRSTPEDRLFVIAAGPMELLYRAVSRSDPSRRSSVTVISHSNWNNNRVYGAEMTHRASDLIALGIDWLAMPDQNPRLNTQSDFAPWDWLRAPPAAYTTRFLYLRMLAAGKADISDAGMVYFLLFNDAYPTPAKLQALPGSAAAGS